MRPRSLPEQVRIEYSYQSGVHTFRAPDYPGFYLASPDAQLVFDDIPGALKLLVDMDFGVDCAVAVEGGLTLEEFFARVIAPPERGPSDGRIRPAGLWASVAAS